MFENEVKFPIAKAIEKSKGIRVHLSTGIRWIRDGVKTPIGQVKLEASTLGGRWYTSVEAVSRFDIAVREAKSGNRDVASNPPRSESQRKRDLARANASLDAMGV